tara:strand:- start:1014 stop:1325 length:312 start_codon:yes stop_codon:yes gene_type:complete
MAYGPALSASACEEDLKHFLLRPNQWSNLGMIIGRQVLLAAGRTQGQRSLPPSLSSSQHYGILPTLSCSFHLHFLFRRSLCSRHVRICTSALIVMSGKVSDLR